MANYPETPTLSTQKIVFGKMKNKSKTWHGCIGFIAEY